MFKKAREDTRSDFHVYVAAALMEYYCSKVGKYRNYENKLNTFTKARFWLLLTEKATTLKPIKVLEIRLLFFSYSFSDLIEMII